MAHVALSLIAHAREVHSATAALSITIVELLVNTVVLGVNLLGGRAVSHWSK
jgi:hypothetical protein